MGDHMQLVHGAQTRAANRIIDALPTIDGALRELGPAIESHAQGLAGSAAQGLAQALRAWFQAAADLPRVLTDYAVDLAGVDQDVATMESTNVEALTTAAGRHGSGLNME